MSQQLITTTLLEKRSEILNEIEHLEKIIKIHKENLVILSKTIQIFDSSCSVPLLTSKKVSTVKRFAFGELKRLIFDILKEIKEPISTTALIEIIAKRKNIIYVDVTDERNFQKAVLKHLGDSFKAKLVEQTIKDGKNAFWQIRKID